MQTSPKPTLAKSPKPASKPARLSDADCRQIALEYDGTSECIDRLLAEWSGR